MLRYGNTKGVIGEQSTKRRSTEGNKDIQPESKKRKKEACLLNPTSTSPPQQNIPISVREDHIPGETGEAVEFKEDHKDTEEEAKQNPRVVKNVGLGQPSPSA